MGFCTVCHFISEKKFLACHSVTLILLEITIHGQHPKMDSSELLEVLTLGPGQGIPYTVHKSPCQKAFSSMREMFVCITTHHTTNF